MCTNMLPCKGLNNIIVLLTRTDPRPASSAGSRFTGVIVLQRLAVMGTALVHTSMECYRNISDGNTWNLPGSLALIMSSWGIDCQMMHAGIVVSAILHIDAIRGPCILVNMGSGNGLSPVRGHDITWIHGELSPIGPLGTHINQRAIYPI